MKSARPHTLATYDSAGRFDLAVEWLLLALLAFMPFAYGAVEAWSEQVVVALAGAIAVCLAAKFVVCRGARFAWSWELVPVGLFVALVLAQLVPLPASLLGRLSPNTTALRAELLGDLPDAAHVLSRQTLSLYPHATRHDLVLLAVVVTVFLAVLNVHRQTRQVKRLLLGIAVIGSAAALLSLGQFLGGATTIYGLVPAGSKASGPFLNHSHFGQFMNLSIGAALGLLMVYVEEIFGRSSRGASPHVAERRRQFRLRAAFALAGGIVLGAAAVFVSLTRGGILALLIAGALTGVVITLRKRRGAAGRGALLVVLGLALFGCLLYLGFDAIYDRVASIAHFEESSGGRGQILKDLTQAWAKFPVLGTGLGTHETVFPMFDRSAMSSLATHAENEYAQMAEETGFLGLGLVAAFVICVVASYRRTVRRLDAPVQAAAFGLGLGLLAAFLHSFTDFGQHVPANACLTAVSAGLVVNLARWARQPARPDQVAGTDPTSVAAAVSSLPLRAAVALGVLILAAAGLVITNAARQAEARWGEALAIEARLEADGWQGSDAQFAALLGHAEAAAELQPTSIHYRYGLNAYRWRAASRVRDPESGSLVRDERLLASARRVVDEIHRARPLCPTFGMSYTLAGQIELFVLDDPAGRAHVERGYTLSSWDPTAASVAAELDVDDGRWDDALAKHRRAVALGFPLRDAVELYVEARRPDLAMRLVQGDQDGLHHLAASLEERGFGLHVASAARARARELLVAACDRPEASRGELIALAAVLEQERDYERAIELYRRALAIDYGDVGSRLALAQAFAASGQLDAAVREARICLRLRPGNLAAEKLIAELRARSGSDDAPSGSTGS